MIYPFSIGIECIVTSFDFLTSLQDHTYTIFDALYSGHDFDTEVLPSYCSCPSTVTYTITYSKNGLTIPMPSFITNDPVTDKKFNIHTVDSTLEGQYLIIVTAEIPNLYSPGV